MTFRFGMVTDLHFGPQAYYKGKLRKLTHCAADLTREVMRIFREELHPDMVVNLGDDIEDESAELDKVRYLECQSILKTANSPLINVAGNHDTIHLSLDDLNECWGRTGHLYYSFEQAGFHWTVLHTLETKDVGVHIDRDQMRWIQADLEQSTLPVVILMHHSASEQDLTDSRWFSTCPQLALVAERSELRTIFQNSHKVIAVFNGHVHRNYLDIIEGIPYVTLQSMVENLDDDAPGKAAASYAWVELASTHIVVRVLGNDRASYQWQFPGKI
jgi:3',5'-cyclic-AMP phosphodiesterase